MPELSLQKKQKVNKIILFSAFIFLLVSFIPHFIGYKVGLIVLVFCMVAVYYIKIVVDDAKEAPVEKSDVEEIIPKDIEPK